MNRGHKIFPRSPDYAKNFEATFGKEKTNIKEKEVKKNEKHTRVQQAAR